MKILALIIVLAIMWLVWRVGKKFLLLLISSVIGLFALFGFNFLFQTGVNINFWSVIITAIGGIIGFGIVIGMHFLGWAF